LLVKLVKVEHLRCGDVESPSYFMAPNSMEIEEIKEHLRTAKKAYQDAVDAYVREKKENPDRRRINVYHFEVGLYPETMTIAEAKAQWKADVEVEKARDQVLRDGLMSYDSWVTRLTPLRTIHFAEPDVFYTVDWGHQHSSPLEYGEKSDPIKYGAHPLNPEVLEEIKEYEEG
jgi:hypothetical protein